MLGSRPGAELRADRSRLLSTPHDAAGTWGDVAKEAFRADPGPRPLASLRAAGFLLSFGATFFAAFKAWPVGDLNAGYRRVTHSNGFKRALTPIA